jgi:hypothetical protein
LRVRDLFVLGAGVAARGRKPFGEVADFGSKGADLLLEQRVLGDEPLDDTADTASCRQPVSAVGVTAHSGAGAVVASC